MRTLRLATGPSYYTKRGARHYLYGQPHELLRVAVEPMPGIKLVPSEYRDLAEAFSEKECDILPPTMQLIVQLKSYQGLIYLSQKCIQ